ncbi:hypothetical protein C8T65DRAFT_174982 [Cerioporus squamosus]|nr:hypothetical protein C8T65DRAFT_174982 [Cerioporus squamosus]
MMSFLLCTSRMLQTTNTLFLYIRLRILNFTICTFPIYDKGLTCCFHRDTEGSMFVLAGMSCCWMYWVSSVVLAFQ